MIKDRVLAVDVGVTVGPSGATISRRSSFIETQAGFVENKS